MNRRRFLTTAALVSLLPEGAMAKAAALPTYTVTLPGKITVPLQISDVSAGESGRKLRVWNRQVLGTKPVVHIDMQMTADSSGQPTYCRIVVGLPPFPENALEAKRDGDRFLIQEPAEKGDLAFGAALFAPLIAELFLGKQYDFKKGGPQNFAHFIDYNIQTAKIDTLTLTVEGEETITLPDGPVKARKMNYRLDEEALPEAAKTGSFYVGPSGEVLKCDTAFFGVPLQAKGPATWEEGGNRFILRFQNPDSGKAAVALRADKRTGGDWAITLEFVEGPTTIATAVCDSRYQLKSLDTPWHGGRKFTAVAAGNSVHWDLAAGQPQTAPLPPNKPVWFTTEWFFTSLWEGTGGTFASLAVGDTGEGVYFPLFTGQRNGDLFTLERMEDIPVNRRGVADAPLRHYRFYAGGKEKAQGNALDARYDLYTDGSLLVAFLGTDDIRIVRDGWATFADALTPPAKG